MMEDLELVAAIVAVLLSKSVEAVRAGSHYSLDSELLEGHHVGLGEHLEEEFVARPAGGVARASLLHAEDTDIQSCLLQQGDGRARHLLVALVEAGSAAYEVDVLGGLADLDIEVGGPVGALVRTEAVWV